MRVVGLSNGNHIKMFLFFLIWIDLEVEIARLYGFRRNATSFHDRKYSTKYVKRQNTSSHPDKYYTRRPSFAKASILLFLDDDQ
jgi:hypothetical protein